MSEYTDDEVHRSCEIGRWVEKRRVANDAIESEVKAAHSEGMSWAKIGLAVGTSGQAAWERYGMSDEARQQLVRLRETRFSQPGLPLDGFPSFELPKKQPRKNKGQPSQERY